MKELRDKVVAEISKTVVGQSEAAEMLVLAACIGGHVLVEGVPGVAKTLIARAFARAVALDFGRVQFTPDMLPSDLTGTMTLRHQDLVFRPGPVFAEVLLADEINRTPPKTQSALLEAMQERQVTVDGVPHPLPDSFVVLATQNPVEYEGTYPLPEAQLDRFLFKVEISYPSEADETTMVTMGREGLVPSTLDRVQPVATRDDLLSARRQIDRTTVSDEVAHYVVAIVRSTRDLPSVELGASPRAAVHLTVAAKAAARAAGRDFITPDDVVSVAPAVLRHRVVLRPEAELERFSPDQAIATAVQAVAVPR
ncbi:MAG: MoxR family ATPase [Actinomycetota bacterium]|nr:MoxR family ATPase [Actinomycetota bacterium]